MFPSLVCQSRARILTRPRNHVTTNAHLQAASAVGAFGSSAGIPAQTSRTSTAQTSSRKYSGTTGFGSCVLRRFNWDFARSQGGQAPSAREPAAVASAATCPCMGKTPGSAPDSPCLAGEQRQTFGLSTRKHPLSRFFGCLLPREVVVVYPLSLREIALLFFVCSFVA